MFAWASGSDGSAIRIAHIGFSYPGRRQLWRIEQAVPSCLGDGERLIAFLPGPAHLSKGNVLGRRASDAVVVTTLRLLLLGVRDGDLLLLEFVSLGDVEIMEYGDHKSPVKLRVRGQQMWVLVHPKYAGRTGSVRKAAVLASSAQRAGEPPIEAALRGEGFELVVRIDGYEHEWLFATVSVKLPDGQEHTMDCEPCIRTVEPERFVHELTGLVGDESGRRSLRRSNTKSTGRSSSLTGNARSAAG